MKLYAFEYYIALYRWIFVTLSQKINLKVESIRHKLNP